MPFIRTNVPQDTPAATRLGLPAQCQVFGVSTLLRQLLLRARDVPALYADGGEDLLEGGVEAGRKAGEDYGRNRYHGPKDEFDAATWKLDGTIEDLQLLHGVGKELAAGDRWPNWYEGNPFKANRDRMMEGRRGASE